MRSKVFKQFLPLDTETKKMQPIETIDDLERMTKAHNYNKWIYSLFAPYLGRRILEIGGGIGNMTQFLTDREKVVTVETNPLCAERLRTRFKNNSCIRVTHLDISSQEALELKQERLDTGLVINVLEHIERDKEFIDRMLNLLEPFAKVIFIVPAHKFLFGVIDQHIGHLRRYSQKEIVTLVRETGIEIIKTRYFNILGMLGWWFNSKILKITAQSEKQIYFFNNYIVPILSKIEKVLPPPIGQSLLVIGYKREGTINPVG